MSDMFDILVVGGGVNGTAIARDAANRGLKTALAEMDDLASATSSASTKLIHGGLRYLEHYEFRLVRESLRERDVLLKAAPHIIWPQKFILPHHKDLRPKWMLRAGLFLYDHLAGQTLLPNSKSVKMSGELGGILETRFKNGFSYYDCWVEDARLSVLQAMDARDLGADIWTRTKVTKAERKDDHWSVTLSSGGKTRQVKTRILVNATGPWAVTFYDHLDGAVVKTGKSLRAVKGSHIIVPKIYEGDHAYIFQNPDKRIIFAIPYEHDFTLIGTTEELFEGNPAKAEISDAERDYLIKMANAYFEKDISQADIVWTYSGVRPLFDELGKDASAVTRDYVFDIDDTGPTLLTVFGGKLTTCRKLAANVLDKLGPYSAPQNDNRTRDRALPGGEFSDFDALLDSLSADYPWLDTALARRYARAYGLKAWDILEDAKAYEDLGEDLGGGLYEAEVRYLVAFEWAQTVEDILWRRSKLGLHVPKETAKKLKTLLQKIFDRG